MSLSTSSVRAGRVYSRTSDRSTPLYRRVINTGTRAECTSPECRPPLRRLYTEAKHWVRYETQINGLWLVRACSLEAFARWAEKREPARKFVRPPITFTAAEHIPERTA